MPGFNGVITVHGEVYSSSLPAVEQLEELLKISNDKPEYIMTMIDTLKKEFSISDQDIKNFIGFIQRDRGGTLLGQMVIPSEFISWYKEWVENKNSLVRELSDAFSDDSQAKERAEYVDTFENLIQKFVVEDRRELIKNLLLVYYVKDIKDSFGIVFGLHEKIAVYDFAKILDKIKSLLINDKRYIFIQDDKRDIGWLCDVILNVKNYVLYGK